MNPQLIRNQSFAQIQAPDSSQQGQAGLECSWVLAAQSGDRAAFGKLSQCYQRRCASVALRLLGNVHDTAEVVQEAFISAYRHLDQLQEPERFAPWLLRIVTNVAFNYRRARARRQMTSIDQSGPGGGEELCSNLSRGLLDAPDKPAACAELGHAIQRSIDALPRKQRLALVLFSIEKMPQKKVAEVLECSVEAVKWHVCMARKQLRKSLASYV